MTLADVLGSKGALTFDLWKSRTLLGSIKTSISHMMIQTPHQWQRHVSMTIDRKVVFNGDGNLKKTSGASSPDGTACKSSSLLVLLGRQTGAPWCSALSHQQGTDGCGLQAGCGRSLFQFNQQLHGFQLGWNVHWERGRGDDIIRRRSRLRARVSQP